MSEQETVYAVVKLLRESRNGKPGRFFRLVTMASSLEQARNFQASCRDHYEGGDYRVWGIALGSLVYEVPDITVTTWDAVARAHTDLWNRCHVKARWELLHEASRFALFACDDTEPMIDLSQE